MVTIAEIADDIYTPSKLDKLDREIGQLSTPGNFSDTYAFRLSYHGLMYYTTLRSFAMQNRDSYKEEISSALEGLSDENWREIFDYVATRKRALEGVAVMNGGVLDLNGFSERDKAIILVQQVIGRVNRPRSRKFREPRGAVKLLFIPN